MTLKVSWVQPKIRGGMVFLMGCELSKLRLCLNLLRPAPREAVVWTSGHVDDICGLCRGESSVRVPCACRSWHVRLLHERQRMAVCCVTAAGISVSVVTAKLKSRLPGAASLPNFICLYLLGAVAQRERIVFSASRREGYADGD